MELLKPCMIFLMVTVFQHALGANITITSLHDAIDHPGATAYLGCVPSKPEREITWYRNEVKLVAGDRHAFIVYPENSTLEIKFVSKDDLGMYICKEDGSDTEAIVHLKAAPFVYNTRSINMNAGNTLNLECRGFGVPAPLVSWYRDGVKLEEDGKRIQFKNTTFMQNGELVIENLEISDYSKYTCSAVNDYGIYNSTTLVRVKSSLRVLWPMTGIIIQVIALAIIIIVHEKRKKSAKSE